MTFPVAYKILSKAVFESGGFKLIPIRYEDRIKIMKWRNEQIYHLRQTKPLTIADQNVYFENVVSKLFAQEKPDQLLFSFLHKEELVGYGGLVHINWIDRNAEISFVMNTNLEKEYFEEYWVAYLKLIENVAFGQLHFHKIFTYAFDLRLYLYIALEKAGFTKEAVLKEHCLFEGGYKDVIIHSRINIANLLKVRKAEEKDLMLYFEWANDPVVRQNAIHTEQISLNNHINWFKQKLVNKNCRLYLFFVRDNPVAQVRLDKVGKEWVISYSIAHKYRGLKLGILIIRKVIELHPLDMFFALVKVGNIASEKVFENLNFRKGDDNVLEGISYRTFRFSGIHN